MLNTKTSNQRIAELEKEQRARTEFVGEENSRSKAINRKIRERYSLSDELAIMRKALAKIDINDIQLNEYNEFVEKCKQEVDNEKF